MASMLDWLVKERCLWHAEPIFDRDGAGHAVFRCPRCMTTWPILPGQTPRRRSASVIQFDLATTPSRQPVPRSVLASGLE